MSLDQRRLEPIIGKERLTALLTAAAELRERVGDRRIVSVNSTAKGGGVAEMLATLLGYARGLGVEVDWVVIPGDSDFFAITKRIHNGLYGSPGDGGALSAAERAHYDRVTAENAERLRRIVRSGDIVLVHDPQPAGLLAPLVELGACVVWRCHVGFDGSNEWTERAWAFLRSYVEVAHAHVFPRVPFAPSWIDPARLRVIPPSIDPFAPKNRDQTPSEVLALLSAAGLLASDGIYPDERVRRPARVVRERPAADPKIPLVVQVSRWDRIKDMGGVLESFVRHVGLDDVRLVGGDDDDGARPTTERSGALRRPRFDIEAAKARLAADGGYEIIHESAGLEIGVYVLVAPEPDHQQPHLDDEDYIVLDGRGTLDVEGEQVDLREGHAVFVPAGAKHQFVGYEQLSVLVIFEKGRR